MYVRTSYTWFSVLKIFWIAWLSKGKQKKKNGKGKENVSCILYTTRRDYALGKFFFVVRLKGY